MARKQPPRIFEIQPQEKQLLMSALDLAIASAKRATKQKQLPGYQEAAERHAEQLVELRAKVWNLT